MWVGMLASLSSCRVLGVEGGEMGQSSLWQEGKVRRASSSWVLRPRLALSVPPVGMAVPQLVSGSPGVFYPNSANWAEKEAAP